VDANEVTCFGSLNFAPGDIDKDAITLLADTEFDQDPAAVPIDILPLARGLWYEVVTNWTGAQDTFRYWHLLLLPMDRAVIHRGAKADTDRFGLEVLFPALGEPPGLRCLSYHCYTHSLDPLEQFFESFFG